MSANAAHQIPRTLVVSQLRCRIRNVHTVSTQNASTHHTYSKLHVKKPVHIPYPVTAMLNDVNYRFDNKYLKKSFKDLELNIKWLQDVNSLEGCLGDTTDNGVMKDLFILLDRFDNVPKLEDGYARDQMIAYLDSKHVLLEKLVPYLRNTTPEFRRNHILTNPLVQYIYKILVDNLKRVDTETLVKYFEILVEIHLEEVNFMAEEIYLEIYDRLSDVYSDDSIHTMIKLTSRIAGTIITDRIRVKTEELLVETFCNDVAFRKNIAEIIQIIYSYHLVSNSNRFIMEYMELFTQKLMSYAHTLSNDEIIGAMYLLYKVGWTETATFNKIAEAFLFRVNSITYEQMEALASLMAGYKYLFTAKNSDIGETIYSEGVRMLTSMIRDYFEDKLVNLRLTKMLDPLVNITALTKVTTKMKSLTLAKLDRDLVYSMNAPEFHKFLLSLAAMRIGKNNDKVSSIVRGYIAANNKLMIGEGLSDDQKAHLVTALGDFIPKKHYNRYVHIVLRDLIEDSIGRNEALLDTNGLPAPIVEITTNSKLLVALLKVYVTNGLHRLDGTDTRVSKVVAMLTSRCVTDPGAVLTAVNIDQLVLLLKGLYYSQLKIDAVNSLVGSVFERINDAVKSGTRLRASHINDVVTFAVQSRVVVPGLREFVTQLFENHIAGILGDKLEDVGVMKAVLASTYLKCVRFLGLSDDVGRTDLMNTYDYLLKTVGCYSPSPGQISARGNWLGEVVSALKELMVWEQAYDPDVYNWLVGRTSLEVAEHLKGLELFPCTKGKMHEAMRTRFGEFDSHAGEGGVKFDLFSESKRKAIHIMRREDYFIGRPVVDIKSYFINGHAFLAEGDDVYQKHRPYLAQLAAKTLGIELKLVPEHMLI